MTSDKVLRLLVCWMVTLAVYRLRISALATMFSDGADLSPRAPRVVDGSAAPTGIVIQDHRDMFVNFTLTVTGNPLPKCDGWFFQIDPTRKEIPRNPKRFVCKALNTIGDSDGRSQEFHLIISNPTKQDIGQYTVRFFNSEGSAVYKFEIKGKEENKTWPVVYIAIATAIGGVIVFVTIVAAIAVVCRGHCCRSRRSVERARDSVYDDSGTLRKSTRKPHSRSKPAKPQRTSCQNYNSTTTTNNNNNTTTAAATPKAESSSAAALPCACATFPPPSPPLVDSYSNPEGGRKFLCVEPEELAKAISSTLKRLQSKRSNNVLMKSRRMSRSVPGLHEIAGSNNNNLTLPRKRLPFQALMPPSIIAAAASAREMGHRQQHQHQKQQQQQQKKRRAKRGSAEDSGFAAEWEEDDSVFDSVSTAAAGVTRRRKYSLDEHRCQFWRRSLQLVSGSGEVTSDSDSNEGEGAYSKVEEETGRNANSLNESKYVSMTRFYRGSRFPSQHKEAGDVPELPAPCPDSPPLPLPPPPLPCAMQRVYENLC